MTRILSIKFFLLFIPLGFFLIVLLQLLIPKTDSPTLPLPSPTSVPPGESSFPNNKKAPLTINEIKKPDRLIGLNEGFILELSQTPLTSDFYYEVVPSKRLNLVLKGTTVSISPLPKWDANTEYKIIIKKTTKDMYNNFLDKDYQINFKTVSDGGF